MELIFVVLGVLAVWVLFSQLSARITSLEKKIEELTQLRPSVTPSSVQSQATVVSAMASMAKPMSAATQSEPGALEQFGSWVKEDWLLKLGAFLLLLGFGWLASYAFIQGWIGPSGRIVLGLALGALILVLGFWRMQKYPSEGSVFLVLGSTTILLTTYAARALYGFFTPTTALGLMFLASTFVALAGALYNRRALGVASVALAGVAPLLTSSPTNDYIGLFAYLAVVVVGAVVLAAWKNHREVLLTALVVITLYSVGILMDAPKVERDMLLLFACGFALLFYAANTVSLLRRVGDEAIVDLVVATGNALLLAAWIYVAVPETLQSLIYAGVAVLFSVGAFMTSVATKRYESFYVYAAIGIAYIAAATAAELQGATLVIAYTIEAGLVSLLTFILTRNTAAAHKAAYLLLAPTLLSFGSIMSSAWGRGIVFNADFFVLLTLAVVYLFLGGALFEASRASSNPDVRRDNAGLLIAGSLYVYVLLWLSLHEIFPDDTAVFVCLVIYTIVGISAYISGIAARVHALRTYGGILLGLVVVRLLLIDVWDMELTLRIITFFAVGVLFMSTAFIGKKSRTDAAV